MKKYLITIDLDGTLLNSSSTMSNDTIQYLQNLQAKGHKILLATGRPYRGTKYVYDQLNLNTPLIVDNGATIYPENDQDFKAFEIKISKEVSDNLFNFAKEGLVSAFYNVDNELYIYNYLKDLEFFYFLNPTTTIIEGELDNKNYPLIPNFILTVTLDFHEKFEDFINNSDDVDFRYWFKDENIVIYEVFPRGYNKATALNHIRNYYNIPKENTISFGDGSNDIELLDHSEHGVMMINGSKRLAAVSDATTSHTNDEDGVVKYLQKFIK